jgi:enamine deaminase RidA (YjgF/YER057c/UK114 family)
MIKRHLVPSAPPPPGGVFANLVTIVEAAGYTLKDTVFVRIYLADFDRDYDSFNLVYHRFFPDADAAPSRTTIGIARLGRGALVEIDLTLYRAPSR